MTITKPSMVVFLVQVSKTVSDASWFTTLLIYPNHLSPVNAVHLCFFYHKLIFCHVSRQQFLFLPIKHTTTFIECIFIKSSLPQGLKYTHI